MFVSIGARIKEVFKHGIVFGLTSSIQSALSFILLPLYTKYLSVDEFGSYSMLLVISAICQCVLYLGASTALGRYYYEYKEKGKEKEIVSASLFISFLGMFIQVALALLSADLVCEYYFHDLSLITPYIICLIAGSIGYPVTTLTLLLRYQKQSKFYLVVTIFGLLINFGITISLLIYTETKISAPFIGLLVSNLLILSALLTNSRDQLTFNIPNEYIRLILSIGLPFAMSSLLSYSYQASDKMVMKELMSIADVGVYSLGYRIASLFHILIYLPFTLIWGPLRMEYKDSPDNKLFIKEVTSLYSLIGTIFIVICMIWGYDVLQWFFPQEEYSVSLRIFPIIMLAYIFYGFLGIFDFGVFINNKVYFFSLIPIICLILNVGLNFLLIPQLGISAAAYVFVITYAVSSLVMLFVSNKYYPIKYDWSRIILSILLVVGTYYLLFNCPFEIFGCVWKKLILSFLVLVYMWLVLVSRQEKLKILKYSHFNKEKEFPKTKRHV